MTRVMTLAAALALLAAGPLASTSAEAFFVKKAAATSTADSAGTLGVRADQLKIGSKRWFEQMEREGRLGGPRG